MVNKLKPKGEFGRNVLTLMTGTVIAQAIPIAAAPILTRIYTPEDFGVFALYTAIVSLFAVIATGRYELAVMHPSKDEDAKLIVILSLLINSILGFILAIIVVIFNLEIAGLFNNPKIGDWLYFIPFTVLITGWYQTFSYWLNRKKCYKQLSQNKVIQTGSITIVQFSEGYLGIGAEGLLAGHLAGWLISLSSISRSFDFQKNHFCTRKIKQAAYLYRNYPLMQAPTSFLNAASSQAPVFFLTATYISSTVGFYNLTVKVLTAPIAIISKTMGQVYFQRISEIAQTSPDKLVSEILYTTKKLSVIAIIIFFPIMFYGKELFYLVFGPAWEEAGFYAQILSPAVAIKFIVSPISTIFLATEKIKLGSVWQVLYFMTSLIMFFLAIKYEIRTFLWIYLIHELCLYSLYFYLMLMAAKTFSKDKII